MLSTLTSIAQFLNGLPERKNLIWMAGSFPFIGTSPNPDLSHELKEVVIAISTAQIAVYPVDVGGLMVDDPSNGGYLGQGIAAVGNLGSSTLYFEYKGLDDLARDTGGQAIHGRNDLKNALAEAVETGAQYYTLIYSPTNQNYDGKLRKIQVGLPRHVYNLAYRSSYYALDTAPQLARDKTSDSPQPTAAKQIGDSLYTNMQHGAPMAHELVFRAQVHTLGAAAPATPVQMENLAEQPAYFRVRHKNKPEKPLAPIPLQTYAIDYTLMSQAKNKAGMESFEIAAAVFDVDGHMLNGVVNNAIREGSSDPLPDRKASPAAKSKDSFYHASQSIDVPLAATSIRIAVRDMLTDRIGTMEIELPLAAEPRE